MKKCFFILIGEILFFSCASDGPGLKPFHISYRLLHADSTSVVTSVNDRVVVSYKDKKDGMIRQSYNVNIQAYPSSQPAPWAVKDSCYVLSWGYVDGDSIFMSCKNKVDTLVEISNQPLEIIFNGKRTYIPDYQGQAVPLVR